MMISMHIGENKAPIPRLFQFVGKGQYKVFTLVFASFNEECYSELAGDCITFEDSGLQPG